MGEDRGCMIAWILGVNCTGLWEGRRHGTWRLVSLGM